MALFNCLGGNVSENVYKCTGEDDAEAISALVNDFLLNGTDMAMTLRVEGELQLGTGNWLGFNGANARKATCTVDLSGCSIPEIISNQNISCLDISTDFVKVVGLHVEVTYTAPVPSSTAIIRVDGNYNTLQDCVVVNKSTGTTAKITVGGMSGNFCKIDSCVFTTSTARSSSSEMETRLIIANTASDVKIENCVICSALNSEALQMSGYYARLSNNYIYGSTGIYGGQCWMSKNRFDGKVSISEAPGACFSQCYMLSLDVDILGSGTASAGMVCVDACHFFRGIKVLPGFAAVLNITNCEVKGLYLATYGFYATDVSQYASFKILNSWFEGMAGAFYHSGTGSPRWHIMGNSFSASSITVNGASVTAATSKAEAAWYMPAYSNQFGVI